MFYYDSFTPQSLTGVELDHLLAHGWYRMHQSVFTTSHVDLREIYRVHWLRFNLGELLDQGSHRRLRTKNKSFSFLITDDANILEAHEELYSRYRASITFDGALSIRESLFGEGDVSESIFNTKCISVFDKGRLIAGGYFDTGKTSAASILHFYDPDYKKFSLGRYLILITIDYLKEQGYQYYYPGYVMGGFSKMNYKLFLGKEQAQYFDPASLQWKEFHEEILIQRPADIIPKVPVGETGNLPQ